MVPHDLSLGRIGVTKVYRMTGKRRSSPCPVSETGTIYLYYWGFLLPVMGGKGSLLQHWVICQVIGHGSVF